MFSSSGTGPLNSIELLMGSSNVEMRCMRAHRRSREIEAHIINVILLLVGLEVRSF